MDVKQRGFHWFVIITLLLGIYVVLGSPLYQPELGVFSSAGRNFSNFSNVSGTITLNATNLTYGLINGSQNNHITSVTFYWGRVVNSTGQFVRNFTFDNTTVNQSTTFFNTTFNTASMEDDVYNNVTVNITNSSGFSNTTVVYNITIDNYGPTVNITNPSHNSNYSVNTTTNQTFNATIQDQGVDIANVTFNFSNQSGSFLFNSSNNNSGVWGVTVNISSLGQGAHTALVYAYSWLGRGNISQNITFYVDGIAPVVIIDRVNNSNGTTNTTDTTPDVRFNVSDNVFTNVSCTLYVNGNANQSNQSVHNATVGALSDLYTNFTFNTSTSGTYTYYVNCTDGSSNTGQSSVNTLLVDVTAPTVTISAPLDGRNFTNSSNIQNFNATVIDTHFAVDGVANVTFNITNGTAADGFTSINFNATNASGLWGIVINVSRFAQEFHTASVYAYDKLGNLNSTVNITFAVDGVSPVVTLNTTTMKNLSNTSDTTPDIQFNVTDNVFKNASCRLYVNSQLNATNLTVLNSTDTNFTFNQALVAGNYSFLVNCTDGSGNTGTSANLTITIDNMAPIVAFNATTPRPNSNFTLTTGFVNFNGTVTDANTEVTNVTFRIRNNTNDAGRDLLNYTANNQSGTWGARINVSSFTEDFHVVFLVANDTVGNENNTLVNLTFAVDSTAPVVVLNRTTMKNLSNTTDTTPDIQFNVTDNVFTNVSCRLYVNSVLNVTNLSVQNHTDTNMTFTPALVAGNYSFLVNCTDGSGNTGTSANLTITIDNMAPIVSNITPGNNTNFTTYNREHEQQNFNASVIDANTEVTNVTFRIRNGSWGDRNYTASNLTGIWGVVINLSGYFDDNYTVMVVANDTVGNLNDTQNFTLRVDRVAPSVSVGSSSVAETSATISAATNESVNNCTYSGPADGSLNVDGNAQTWSLVVGSLTANTDYTVTVNCTDYAGNNAAASTSFTTSKASSSSSSSGGGSSSSSASTGESASTSTSSESASGGDEGGAAAAGDEGAGGGPSTATGKAGEAAGAGKAGKSTKGRGAFAGRAIFDKIGTALQDLSTLWIVIVVLGAIVGIGIYFYNKRIHSKR